MSQVLLNFINDINVSNTKTGTLLVNYGGTGTNNLNSNQLLVGNGIDTVIQSENLSWNNSTNTLIATNFSGIGSDLTLLNASKITLGTLNVSQGGTGTNNLNSNQLLVGNTTGAVIQSENLSWDNSNNILTATNFSGIGSSLTLLNASKITLGTLNVSQGGTGTTNLTSGQILVGNNTDPIIQNNNFVWDNINNRLGIGKINPSTTLDVSGNILQTRNF